MTACRRPPPAPADAACRQRLYSSTAPSTTPNKQVRQSLEQELQSLMQNGMALNSTAAKFGAAGMAVEYLQEQQKGESMN